MNQHPVVGRFSGERIEDRLARRGGAIELLRLPAAVFGAAAALRGAAYDAGLLRAQRLPVPVVSVGNLTAGGTGKTPAVLTLVRALQRRGARPGVLARGWARVAGDAGLNDEGQELARACPGLLQVQDKDRVRGGRRLVALGAEAIVLDDGFQHRRLARDVDLCLVDATRPWGLAAPDAAQPALRACLPRGLLRERPAALARADALLVTRSDELDEPALGALERELAELAPGKPILRAVHAPRALRATRGGTLAPQTLAGAEVRLVSGIGNPAAFELGVRRLGARVLEHRVFPDHHAYGAADVALLARGGARVLTTAKDAVKLEPLGLELLVLEIELELVRGAAVLDALLDALPLPGAALHGRELGYRDGAFV